LRQVAPNQSAHLEIVCEESGSGSYWQEFAVYFTGIIALAGGVANALHILGEALDAAGNVTPYLGQHMSSAAKWFKGVAWRLTPKPSSISAIPQSPGCFGEKQWLDRRTKRCKHCGFLGACVANVES
jgi:hypothetical protein